MKKVIVFGTFDTKEKPYRTLIEKLQELGVGTITIDLGTRKKPGYEVEYSAEAVASCAGYSLEEVIRAKSRSETLQIMAKGAANIIQILCKTKAADGAISMGGSQGAFLAGQIMRQLPIGFPKLILTTVATLPHAQSAFEGVNDTMIMNSLSDVAGSNMLLDCMIEKCAYAMYGMVQGKAMLPAVTNTKKVGITMWGVTTPCVERIRDRLEVHGIEVYIFHSNGLGGIIMENLAKEGFLDAVADMTITEFTTGKLTNLYGSDERIRLAGARGIPQIVSVGGVDMVNTRMEHVNDPLPERFRNRKVYEHSPTHVFVRSTKAENVLFGKELSDRVNASKGPVHVLLPLRGTSATNAPGAPFWEPETDAALFQTVTDCCEDHVHVEKIDANINDLVFADRVAELILQYLQKGE